MSHDFMFPLHTFDILKHMSALDEHTLLEMTFSFLVTLDTNHASHALTDRLASTSKRYAQDIKWSQDSISLVSFKAQIGSKVAYSAVLEREKDGSRETVTKAQSSDCVCCYHGRNIRIYSRRSSPGHGLRSKMLEMLGCQDGEQELRECQAIDQHREIHTSLWSC